MTAAAWRRCRGRDTSRAQARARWRGRISDRPRSYGRPQRARSQRFWRRRRPHRRRSRRRGRSRRSCRRGQAASASRRAGAARRPDEEKSSRWTASARAAEICAAELLRVCRDLSAAARASARAIVTLVKAPAASSDTAKPPTSHRCLVLARTIPSTPHPVHTGKVHTRWDRTGSERVRPLHVGKDGPEPERPPARSDTGPRAGRGAGRRPDGVVRDRVGQMPASDPRESTPSSNEAPCHPFGRCPRRSVTRNLYSLNALFSCSGP